MVVEWREGWMGGDGIERWMSGDGMERGMDEWW